MQKNQLKHLYDKLYNLKAVAITNKKNCPTVSEQIADWLITVHKPLSVHLYTDNNSDHTSTVIPTSYLAFPEIVSETENWTYIYRFFLVG